MQKVAGQQRQTCGWKRTITNRVTHFTSYAVQWVKPKDHYFLGRAAEKSPPNPTSTRESRSYRCCVRSSDIRLMRRMTKPLIIYRTTIESWNNTNGRLLNCTLPLLPGHSAPPPPLVPPPPALAGMA
uniref:Uncharacterized protein n=1 Tax=Trypanosoma congolense (strain IL3000) TaxID=1068625 RepID=G0UPH0_TRYCI|nr:hypothetical protein, unlikely [Trypanosoma congolense IL3000]